MPRRVESERFSLLVKIVERIQDEPARTESFSFEIHFDQQTGLSHSSREPSRPNLRSLLMEVRKFDSPGDVYLPELLDLASARATDPVYEAGLKKARALYSQLQIHGDLRINDNRGEISPRLSLELWAYGEHLHDDEDKAARMAALPPEVAVMVRRNAVTYMDDLIRIAAYLRAVVLNDPGFA
jgi:hypothetical protein